LRRGIAIADGIAETAASMTKTLPSPQREPDAKYLSAFS
jgi:hypothetical protein